MTLLDLAVKTKKVKVSIYDRTQGHALFTKTDLIHLYI